MRQYKCRKGFIMEKKIDLEEMKRDLDDLNKTDTPYSWLKDHSYEIIFNDESECIAAKSKDAKLVFVGRVLNGRMLFTLEAKKMLVNFRENLLNIKVQIPIWKTYIGPGFFFDARQKLNCTLGNVSICSNQLPNIISIVLQNIYGIGDEQVLREVASKLMLFGTKHFGSEPNIVPEDFSEPWKWCTPYHICYMPAELEAIAEISASLIKNSGHFDVDKFKAELSSKTIPCSMDIAILGRNTHGSGLKNYEPAISLSVPLSTTPAAK